VKTQLNIIIVEKNSSSAAAQDRRIDQDFFVEIIKKR